MADERDGPRGALLQQGFEHAREIVGRVVVVALVGLAEPGQVEREHPVAPGERGDHPGPVARGGLSEAVHQHHRFAAFRPGLVHRDAAAEHRVAHILRLGERAAQPVGGRACLHRRGE
jgi:hypothetical protein